MKTGMKITVKDSSRDVVKCNNCEWEGQIQDADWMQESEFGWCPDCGCEDDFTRTEVNYDSMWEYDEWKARIVVYAMLAGALVFGIIPWVWGIIEEFKFVWNLIF